MYGNVFVLDRYDHSAQSGSEFDRQIPNTRPGTPSIHPDLRPGENIWRVDHEGL